MNSGHRISPSTSPGSDQEHLFNDNFNLADPALVMLIFHSLSYVAVLHTECLKSTVTRLRWWIVLPFFSSSFLSLCYIWCHINLSRGLRCAVLARLSGGAAALGCLVTGSVAVCYKVLRGAWQGNRLWPYSHPAPLVQVSSWRTTPVRATSEIYHSAPLPRKSGHNIMLGLFGLRLGCLVT